MKERKYYPCQFFASLRRGGKGQAEGLCRKDIPGLVVHRPFTYDADPQNVRYRDRYWNLSHSHSGMLIGQFDLRKTAFAVMEKLSQLPVDWNQSEEELEKALYWNTELRQQIRDTVRAHEYESR